MGFLQNLTDSLTNLMTGRGTGIDRNLHRFWHYQPMDPAQVEAAYRTSWLINKIVDLPAMDMVREWREWEADSDLVKRIEAEEKRLGIQAAILEGLVYGRLGGGVVILGTGGDMAAPPRADEKLLYVKAIPKTRINLGAMDWDVASEYFGEPEWFELTGSRATNRIHVSRVLVFKGERVPGLHGLADASQYWGDSVVERVDRAVKNADTATDGFAGLIDEAKVDILRFAELYATLEHPEGEDKIRRRLELATQGKSVHRAIALDKEDEWDQRQINWAGMPDVIKTYLAIVAGAADIPATRLLGKSPDGMNATGDGDMKNYLSSIATRQSMTLRPQLDKLDRLLLPSLKVPVDTPWMFCPLDTPTSKEIAEIAKIEADEVVAIANTGLVPGYALEKTLHARMIESGRWPALQEALDEMPELLEGGPDDLSNELQAGEEVVKESAGEGGERTPPNRAQDQWSTDATPRPLYVQRKLLNANALIAWAREQGLNSTLTADDMHVTVLYSRSSVDPMKMGDAWYGDENGHLRIKPGGPRAIERLGENAVVLLFASWELVSRHSDMIRAGASHDYPEYQPHVTISYDVTLSTDIESIRPYTGELVFGPEIFEPLDTDWKSKISEA